MKIGKRYRYMRYCFDQFHTEWNYDFDKPNQLSKFTKPLEHGDTIKVMEIQVYGNKEYSKILIEKTQETGYKSNIVFQEEGIFVSEDENLEIGLGLFKTGTMLEIVEIKENYFGLYPMIYYPDKKNYAIVIDGKINKISFEGRTMKYVDFNDKTWYKVIWEPK